MTSLDHQFHVLQTRLQNAFRLGPAEIDAAIDFAIDANSAGRADLSITILSPLSARAPDVARIWQLLGLAWREQQEMESALAAFDRAASLAPTDIRIAMGKAQVAFETGRASAHLFKPLRAAAPDDGELALSAAAALFNEGKIGAAEKQILELLARYPQWQRGHDALVSMRWSAGEGEGFDRHFVDSVAAQPDNFELRIGWYRALSQTADWQKADAVIADARRHFGDRIELDAIEACIASELGEDDRAQLFFTKAEAFNDTGISIGRMRHCLRTGRIEQAQHIGLALLNTAAPSAWPYLGIVWRLKGDPRSAWLDEAPHCIRHFDLPISQTELQALAERLRSLHLSTHQPPDQSVRGGTQTLGHLFLRLEPELVQIRGLIRDALRDYVDGLPPFVEGHPLLGTARASLHFEGAWSVRLAAQGFHVVHTHPAGWISSALYVALPESMGTGQAGWLQLGAPPPDLRTGLAPYRIVEPKAGRLVLFPSTMWHGTMPFDNGERLTIAFDVRLPTR